MLLFRDYQFRYIHSVLLIEWAAAVAAGAAGADSAPAAAAARRISGANAPPRRHPPPACARAGWPPLGVNIFSHCNQN